MNVETPCPPVWSCQDSAIAVAAVDRFIPDDAGVAADAGVSVAFAALQNHKFPGNFRELEDTLRTACLAVIKDGDSIGVLRIVGHS